MGKLCATLTPQALFSYPLGVTPVVMGMTGIMKAEMSGQDV